MQLKTTRRHHLITIRKVSIKISTNHKCWRGYGEKGTLLHCWWRCTWCNHYREQCEASLKKKKIELSYDPAIPLLGTYLEKTII